MPDKDSRSILNWFCHGEETVHHYYFIRLSSLGATCTALPTLRNTALIDYRYTYAALTYAYVRGYTQQRSTRLHNHHVLPATT